MKKVFALVIALLVFLAGCTQTAQPKATPSDSDNTAAIESSSKAASVEDPDFRKAKWGMTKEQVKALEDAKPAYEEASGLLYTNQTVAGLPATVIYNFNNDALAWGGYRIDTVHTNKNLYIDDYNNLKEKLSSIYGDPYIDEVTWDNDLFKDDPANYGLSVSIGYTSYIASWKTSRTVIILALNGDNYEVRLTLFYYSPDHQTSTSNTDGL